MVTLKLQDEKDFVNAGYREFDLEKFRGPKGRVSADAINDDDVLLLRYPETLAALNRIPSGAQRIREARLSSGDTMADVVNKYDAIGLTRENAYKDILWHTWDYPDRGHASRYSRSTRETWRVRSH